MDDHYRQRRDLLLQLELAGEPELSARATRLRELYHAREIAGISLDSYDAARGVGQPEAAWKRASEDPGLLRSWAPGLGLEENQLRAMLRPENSGFRAEIYLPDPEILGPGFKPTLVFKGSGGEVAGADGRLRDTTIEDFFGNNFPQSLGMQTDYYDRAMTIAMLLKRAGLDFEIGGHSLGAGKASAASAITGMRAVTFNAAGLHPGTALRFAKQNGNMPLFDTDKFVTAWQVKGDLLNDGVQGDLANLGALDRHRLGSLLADTAGVLRKVPEARQVLERELMPNVSDASQPAMREFLDRLEQGGGARLLRDLPQAAGMRKPPLPAMASVDGVLVHREHAASIAGLHKLASPLLTTLASAARGAAAGSSVGQVVAAGGRLGDRGLDLGGDGVRRALGQAGTFAAEGYRSGGITFAHGMRGTGELAAQWRELGAALEAGVHEGRSWLQARQGEAVAGAWRALGAVAGGVSPRTRRELEERGEASVERAAALAAQARLEAEQARAQGQASAGTIRLAAQSIGDAAEARTRENGEQVKLRLAVAGTVADAVLDASGDRIGAITARAPLSGAALGGTTGLLVGGAVAYRPGSPWTGYDVQGTVRLAREAGPALQEALQRHGMASAMIPSLDGEIARQEQAARALLDARRRGGARIERPLLHTGESGQALDRFLEALKSSDAGRISAASAAMLETPQARGWLRDGQQRLDALQSRQAPAPAVEQEARQTDDAVLAR